ncbi:MAG: family 78 glycoside hydrolase catalytic domain [Phycisphaerae bacterium]|nr:family 78 glycoside hydrolase catalytic domain [Phycisphaerae bacterium]
MRYQKTAQAYLYIINYLLQPAFCAAIICCSGIGCSRDVFSGIQKNHAVTIGSLRCEYMINPLGIDVKVPRLSWAIQSAENGVRQTGYQILVASEKSFLQKDIGDIWDSGKVYSAQSVHVEYNGQELRSCQHCFWKVRIWDQNGKVSDWSPMACWSMGIMQPDEWKANWIQQRNPAAENASKNDLVNSIYPLPIFRKDFSVKPNIKNAIVHISGLGHYELFLNGQKIGNHFLDPAWSVYEKTVYYNTFDITSILTSGDNTFGVMLGKGFYTTKGDRRIHFVNVYRPLKLIVQAHIEYQDGSNQIIVSDDSWKYTPGPLTHCAILGGSSYDARRLPDGWNQPGFDDSTWQPAQQTSGPGGQLKAFIAPPMQTMQVLRPISVDEPETGYFVYDFGQNVSSIPRLMVEGKAGQTIRLTPAEQRHGQTGTANNGKGRVNQARIGSPNYWEYTLKGGGPESWSPQFTYTGYQYIEVAGAVPAGFLNPDDLPVIKELVSVQVRNASAPAGTFECSNALFNNICQLIDWAVQSNMAHVLTDCPHREKLGWLEQSYLMGSAIFWNYDIAAFYTKKIRDIRDSQDANGKIYTVAPNYPVFDDGPFRYSPEWGAAGVFLPWQIYQWYGDSRILEENYDMMKSYVDFMHSTSEDLIALPGLGDWYDYGHGQSLGPSRFTPKTLTSTATFYGCADIVSKTAKLLGNTKDAEKYTILCRDIKEKFNREFFDGRGTYQNNGSPQTANAMALVLGLTPQGKEAEVLETIITDLKQRHYQQTAGDIGYHYLVQALSDNNRSDILYHITNRNEVGSYGYIIKQGWTCLPEAWDATLTSSMNHCMLGHIQQWFQQCLAGIRPDFAGPGFKKCIIKPEITGDIVWCKGTHDTLYGTIKSAWKLENGQFILDVTIPANTSATVYIPMKNDSKVAAESNSSRKGIHFSHIESDKAVFEIESGSYRFKVPYDS